MKVGFGLNFLLHTGIEAYPEGFETLLLPHKHRTTVNKPTKQQSQPITVHNSPINKKLPYTFFFGLVFNFQSVQYVIFKIRNNILELSS